MIDLGAMEYLLAMWFVSNEEGDWLAVVFRAKDDPRWRLQYRFRYYQGGPSADPFSSEDPKSWYEGRAPEGTTEETMKRNVDATALLISMKFGGPVDCIEVRGGPELLIEKAAGRPWFHYQVSTEGTDPELTTDKAASA